MLNWVVWAAGGLVMFSTAWVSAVTLFSVCLSLGFVCAQRFFLSQKSGCCHHVRLQVEQVSPRARMCAVQWDMLVRLVECSQPGELDDRQRPKSVSSLLFHPAQALFCHLKDQSEGELELKAVTVWSSALFRLQPASQASLRHSLAVAMQDHEKEAQSRAEQR